MLTVLSVCSGVDAAYAAWRTRGWKVLAFAEIEPFPCAVLHHHYGCGAPEAMPSPLCAPTAREAAKRDAMLRANAKLPSAPAAPEASGAPVNAGDLHQLDGTRFFGVDVLVGGTPCQSFSVAGLRRGLKDDRGNLALQFVRVANECGAKATVWENVPGVLSDAGNAFGCFLSALAGGNDPAEPGPRPSLGKSGKFWAWSRKRGHHVPKWPSAGWLDGPRRTVAWRVFDAQYFGLAQRRKRVLLVACPRDGADPREILFERSGLRRDTPPRRRTQEGIAGTLASHAFSGGAGGRPEGACAGHFVTQALTARLGGGGPDDNKAQGGFYVAFHGAQDPDVSGDVTHPMGTNQGLEVCVMQGRWRGDDGRGYARPPHVAELPSLDAHKVDMLAFGGGNCSGSIDVAATLAAHGTRQNFEEETFVTHTLRGEGFDARMASAAQRNEPGTAFPGEVTASAPQDAGPSVITEAASEDGTGRGTPIVVCRDVAPSLTSSYAKQQGNSDTSMGPNVVAALAIRGRNGVSQVEMRKDGLANAVLTPSGGRAGIGVGAVLSRAGVRRLTPTECERLQGLPDGHTLIPWRNKSEEQCPDGPRYRACGNAMPRNVMAWLGERIERALTE